LRADLSCEFVDTIPKIDSSATGNEWYVGFAQQ
jgi:hypothetical protein